jgi:hypothetical protein
VESNHGYMHAGSDSDELTQVSLDRHGAAGSTFDIHARTFAMASRQRLVMARKRARSSRASPSSAGRMMATATSYDVPTAEFGPMWHWVGRQDQDTPTSKSRKS